MKALSNDDMGWKVSTGYTPANHDIGIVHIGMGAFHRAHQAVYTDDVLARFGGDWRILGVSLRSTDIATALNTQNGRYFLVVHADQPNIPPEFRVIGSVAGVLAAKHGVTPVLSAMVRPETRIVSLTVTEKAYGIKSQQEGLDLDDPHIIADLATPQNPKGVVGLITRALHLRRAAGHGPFSVLSCDNLPDNGKLVRAGVLDFANRLDPQLADWIRTYVSFPSTMVDRITPAATDTLKSKVFAATGCTDLVPVVTEKFSQWVIEDTFCNGRPAWQNVGALLVEDVAPYEQMKLRMLNGAHSMLAYTGFLSGHKLVRETMADPAFSKMIARHISAAASTLAPLKGVDLEDYAQALLQRFKNPNIAHETYQIAMDGSQKMPQRIFEPALVALENGNDAGTYAFATAAWIRYLAAQHDNGEKYALRDPLEVTFAKYCKAHGPSTLNICKKCMQTACGPQ